MKKVLLAVLISAFCTSLHAQLFSTLNYLTPHYYPGEVYFNDGHVESYEEIELPKAGEKYISVKKVKSEKNRTKINAEDINWVKVWSKDFPDKVYSLRYIHANKALTCSVHQWGYPIAGSKWGVVYQCEQVYAMDKKTGELHAVIFRSTTNPDTPTLFYLMKPGSTVGELIFPALKQKMAEPFKENPRIYNDIKKGKLRIFDIQYILDEMAGGKEPELPADTIAVPEESVESTPSGVVGDDE